MQCVSAGLTVWLYTKSKGGNLLGWVRRAIIADVYEESPALAESLQTKEQEEALWKHLVK